MKKVVLLGSLILIWTLLFLASMISSSSSVNADEVGVNEEQIVGSEVKKNSNKDQEKSSFEEMIAENKASDDIDDIDGDGEEGASQGKGKYVHPSHRPVKALGMIIKAGFFVQPNKAYYVQKGRSVIIKSKFKESIWNRLSGLLILKDPTPNYRWRYSEDMTHWLRFKKKVAHSKNYEFKAKKVGTYYMQSRASSGVLLGLGVIHYYSDVTTIHVVEDPKNIIHLSVDTDEDYLFNLKGLDNITNAHETVDPIDASGQMTWSGDNKSLAKIDPISGEIEANQKGISGEYTITGTFINNDGTQISANKTIEIGGGLDDETVDVGDDATFEIKGIYQAHMMDDWHVEWYESKKGKDIKLKTEKQDLSYTIKNTTMNDHQRHFYAKIYAKTNGEGNQKEHSFVTRTAVLNVLNNVDPEISFDVEVENLTYTKENHKHNTDKVVKGDRIKVTSILNNENPLGVLKYGVFELPLQNNIEAKHIKKVVLDGKVLREEEFSISNDDECPHIRIENLDFIVRGTGEGLLHKIEVEFDAREPDTTMQFMTKPRIHGNTKFESDDSSDQAHNYRAYSDKTLLINYTNDKLVIKPNDISFGKVSNLTSGELLNRTNFNDKSKSVVIIDDHRRKNCKHNLFVCQKSDFKCERNGDTLPVSLRYYDEDGGFTPLTNTNSPIPDEDINSDNESDTDAVVWEKNCGLLMHVDETNGKNIASGIYKAKLEWTAMDVL
ncbi:hypothetical protein [Companilactobacillus kedongensis]|uniref:hypothetical protein n=1 Tax=Companilactobacillus kedongensis TaxID=2486004 RepID=UPI000F7A05DC|nr:hypothetical protein [Companilactobacillus kedongensis]